jgi:integrase
MADVDLDRGVLTIQRSKGRARIVAIRSDLVEEIRGYALSHNFARYKAARWVCAHWASVMGGRASRRCTASVVTAP